MNRLAVLLVIALSPTMFGQEKAAANVTRLVHVQFGNAESIANLINSGPRGVFAMGDNGLHAVVLKGSPDAVKSAEELVKQMDAEPQRHVAPNIEVTVYVVGATSKSQPSSAGPKDLEPVFRQLQSAFPYANYQLLDSIVLRSGEGPQVSTKGSLRSILSAPNSAPTAYTLIYQARSTASEGRPAIHFGHFSFETTAPSGSHEVEIGTELDVQPGQKVVVGKSNIDGGESALFLVVTARFLQ